MQLGIILIGLKAALHSRRLVFQTLNWTSMWKMHEFTAKSDEILNNMKNTASRSVLSEVRDKTAKG